MYINARMLSCARLFVTPWTVAHQAALSIEFSRQENWSGLPFPPPGEIPNPGIKSVSPGFITVPFGNPLYSSIGDKQWKALTVVLTAIHFPIRMLHFVFVL